jgi:hypothetical protein
MDIGRAAVKPREEMALDFDHIPDEWECQWMEWDEAELGQQELAEIEAQAEIEDYRLNGYGD